VQRESPAEIRQAHRGLQLERQAHQIFRALAVLLARHRKSSGLERRASQRSGYRRLGRHLLGKKLWIVVVEQREQAGRIASRHHRHDERRARRVAPHLRGVGTVQGMQHARFHRAQRFKRRGIHLGRQPQNLRRPSRRAGPPRASRHLQRARLYRLPVKYRAGIEPAHERPAQRVNPLRNAR
jgi:hypothetical protein